MNYPWISRDGPWISIDMDMDNRSVDIHEESMDNPWIPMDCDGNPSSSVSPVPARIARPASLKNSGENICRVILKRNCCQRGIVT